MSARTEFENALRYYKQTVWQYIKNREIEGTELHIALLAWNRLTLLHHKWKCSVQDTSNIESIKKFGDEIESLEPLPNEKDESVSPETLARLQKPGGSSVDAYRTLKNAQRFLDNLPAKQTVQAHLLDALASNVSFQEIANSTGTESKLPFLPTAQPNRNNGKLTLKAIEQAIKRYDPKKYRKLTRSFVDLKEIKKRIANALRHREISYELLEEIRFSRFKGRKSSPRAKNKNP